MIEDGHFSHGDKTVFKEITDNLLRHDRYTELGTRHNCCDNRTHLYGHKCVSYHILAKYCIETLLWRHGKFFSNFIVSQGLIMLSLVATLCQKWWHRIQICLAIIFVCCFRVMVMSILCFALVFCIFALLLSSFIGFIAVELFFSCFTFFNLFLI